MILLCIIQKASNALEVLKEVLDVVDAQNPQGARDEFTLDLVEQCSFQEQRVMHVVMASRDERIISRAIELNEQLQKVLAKHDDLLAGRVTMTTTRFDHEEEEEEPEQLITGYDHPLSIESPSREVDTRSPPVVIPPSREADARSSPVVIPPPRSKQNGEVPHPVAIPPHLQSTLRGRGFFRRTRMVLICLAT
ncbi:hypothetical protein JHK86_010753 [Glycine max]|nr:hypothetical protein JHK86_010753 [Glycine max]